VGGAAVDDSVGWAAVEDSATVSAADEEVGTAAAVLLSGAVELGVAAAEDDSAVELLETGVAWTVTTPDKALTDTP